MDDYDGKLIFKNGVEYLGAIENGNINGKGKMTFLNGAVYTGEFINNKIEGEGRLDYSPTESYEGTFTNFKKNGHGVYRNTANGIIYEGEWLADCFHGRGVLIQEGCWRYEGCFSRSMKDGYGEIVYLKSGSRFKGQFRNGVKCGQGEMFWASQNHHFVGEWRDDAICGFGVYTYGDTLDFNRYINNIYVGPMVGSQKDGIGFHIFSDGSILTGRWVLGSKEGDFVYRDSFGHFCLKKFVGNHLKTNSPIKVDSTSLGVDDISLPKVAIINLNLVPEVFVNLLKTFYSFTKEVYKEHLTEAVKKRAEGRKVYCLTLEEALQVFKGLRLFDCRLSPQLFERLIRSSCHFGMVTEFKSQQFQAFVTEFTNFMAGRIGRLTLPYDLRTVPANAVYLSCSQFISALFAALQIKFPYKETFEHNFRRYIEDFLMPVAQKKVKLVSLIQDQKSILSLYTSFVRQSKSELEKLFSFVSARDGTATNRQLLRLLTKDGLFDLTSAQHVSIFLRVVERYNNPFASLYAAFKARKQLQVLTSSNAFHMLLNCPLSFDEFVNSLMLCVHKLFSKKGDHFPKNESVNFVTKLFDLTATKATRPRLVWGWFVEAKNKQSSRLRTLSAIKSGVLSMQSEQENKAVVEERNRMLEELTQMNAEDKNALLFDLKGRRSTTGHASAADFKDSVPELPPLPKRSF